MAHGEAKRLADSYLVDIRFVGIDARGARALDAPGTTPGTTPAVHAAPLGGPELGAIVACRARRKETTLA